MLWLLVFFLLMLLGGSITLLILSQHHHHAKITRLSALTKVLEQENSEYAREMEDLRIRKGWYQDLFANAEDVVFVYDIAPDGYPGNLLDVNEKACLLLGYSKEELLNLKQTDIEKEQDAIPAIAYVDYDKRSDEEEKKRGRYATRASRLLVERILAEKNLHYSGVYVAKNNSDFPVEINAHRIDLDNKPLILCSAHDITSRRLTQSALDESEQRFRSLFAFSPIGMVLYDRDHALLDVNTACLRMFGVPTMEEFRQVNIFNSPFIPVEIRKRIAAGEAVDFETTWDFEDIRSKALFVTSKAGQANFEIMINNLGHDRDFRTKGSLVQVQDITERYKAQLALRQSERMLRQAEKMEALGSMAGGIAHDFNNILTPLLGYAEIALRSVQPDTPIHIYLQEILKASHRAKELVTQILNFSRRQDKEGQPLHLIPIIKEVITLIRATMPESIEIQRIIKTERDIVRADATQMHQVFMNLCTNAWHAMRENPSGTLEVRVTDFLLDRPRSELPGLVTGRYLRVSIRDTGTGMEQATLEKIFEPFFTTKKKGEGTGLGLSVVHGIVSACKGTVQVETELGKGSTFHVILPLLDDQVDALVSESTRPLPTGKERVLIVDDENEISTMVAHMLASLGYHPDLAGRGQDALAKFQACPERYDLIITDQVMPGMSGTQLSMKMLETRKNLPIILCTGFSDAMTATQVQELGIRALIMKPIVMSELADIVRRVLDEKR